MQEAAAPPSLAGHIEATGIPWKCKGQLPSGAKCGAILGRIVGRELYVDLSTINQGSGQASDKYNGMVMTDRAVHVCCRQCKTVKLWEFGRR